MKKSYRIGSDRSLRLNIGNKNDSLSITEKNSNNWATFTPARWASFLLCRREIDRELKKLLKHKDVNYHKHYGGGWHVSVTSGYQCVDLRKFYMPAGSKQIKPTKEGIALRLTEWPKLKRVIGAVNRYHKTVADFTPCSHVTQRQIEACSECTPYTTAQTTITSDIV